MKSLVEVNQGIVNTISSLEVAEMLEKDHWMVIRDIVGNDNVVGIIPTLADNNFVVSDYFIENTYKDKSGKSNKCYEVTKMGCEILGNKQNGVKGILFTAKYVKKFNDMESVIKNNIQQLSQEQLIALQILDHGTDAIVLKQYKDIIHQKATEKAKDGTDRLLSLTQIVHELNKHLNNPVLTTTVLNEFLSDVLELGEYKKFGKDKKRSFLPNEKFQNVITKSGSSLTGLTNKKDKLKIQFSTDMLNYILKYKSQLEQYINSKVA